MSTSPNVIEFVDQLDELRDAASVGTTNDDQPPLVPYREVFALAKKFIDTPPDEIEQILELDDHQTRIGAVSIMDFQARRKSTPPERRRCRPRRRPHHRLLLPTTSRPGAAGRRWV